MIFGIVVLLRAHATTGLAQEIPLVADRVYDLTRRFVDGWRAVESQRSGGSSDPPDAQAHTTRSARLPPAILHRGAHGADRARGRSRSQLPRAPSGDSTPVKCATERQLLARACPQARRPFMRAGRSLRYC